MHDRYNQEQNDNGLQLQDITNMCQLFDVKRVTVSVTC
jgi:hypothetical protein